ncbi:MAG: S8 family serine peptidase, partial [Anaerolineae bacterium]
MTGMAFRVAGKGSKHLLSRYGRKRAAQVSAVLALVALLGLLLLPGRPATVNLLAAPPEQGSPQFEALRAKAEANGTVRVIVGLNVAAQPEGKLAGAGAVQAQRQAIAAAQQSVLRQMAGTNTAPVVNFKYIPFMTLTVDAAALAKLNALPETATLEEDVAVPPTLASAIPVIGADHAWAAGYTGQGQTVAILDTGVEKTHDFFTTGGNKVVSEACYSNAGGLGGATSVCPGGVFSSTAVGSGVDCTAATAGFPDAQDGCSHGTHVAGIVAGNDGGANIGVAKDADLIAVQVFSMFTGPVECGVGHASCVKTFTTDQLLGLQRVYELRTSYTIAAVNMSLGGGKYTAVCDAGEPVRKVAMDLLRSVGIATIVATGNDGYTDGMGAPACISTAVSVGATDDDDNVADFSNI